MKCSVLRSGKKDFTYIYLLEGLEFGELPIALRKVFGIPEVVMTLRLTPKSKLALEDVNQVMKNLAKHGYHLQMPPQKDTTGLLDLPFTAKRSLLK